MRFFRILLTLGLLSFNALAEDVPIEQTIALGAVQGITEFLPVSSTGHMILVNDIYFHAKDQSEQVQKALDDYMVCIQLGTILTLLLFYRRDVMRIIKGCLGCDKNGFKLGWNLGVAFIPTGVVGFILGDWIQGCLYGKIFVAFALILGGIAILLFENFRKKQPPRIENIYELSVKSAWIVGLFQMLALWPGFSRSLATIIGCICVGMCLKSAIHFSFLLGLLTSGVATFYKFFKHGAEIFQAIDVSNVLLGILVAFGLGMSTIHIFLAYLRNHGLKIFGYYRVVVGLILSIF